MFAKDCSALELVFMAHRKALLFVDTKNHVRLFDLRLNQISKATEFQIKPHSKLLLTPDEAFLVAVENQRPRKFACADIDEDKVRV